jgi:ribosomal protein S18 acetylase RimI-like enzyme
LKNQIKKIVFGLLGKDPEAVVVAFASGPADLSKRMAAEVRELEPGRRHFLVQPDELKPGSAWSLYRQLRQRFAGMRIGLAPVLFTDDRHFRELRWAAFLLAPGRILAYNRALERHHLRLRTWIASLLFLRGVALDRIYLRPSWIAPWKKDRSVYPVQVYETEGRDPSVERRRIGVLTPYFPYPLSHGGAVRIFHLIRELASGYDVFLFSFREGQALEDIQPLLPYCARIFMVDKPRYREPRWSTLAPPEAREFDSPSMHKLVRRKRREWKLETLQVEYTFLAPYRGEILVAHDLTWQLYTQVHRRRPSLKSWWDAWRWRRFERHWAERYKRVVVMSEEDRQTLGSGVTIPNGVDLDRFEPTVEQPGERLLFVGSFRHFPNVLAWRFFLEEIWPLVKKRRPKASVVVVAGPDPLIHWREQTGLPAIPEDPGIELLSFVADVRPLYAAANVVVVPTLVSAGTNLKVLEALAMRRAVVSTSSGCAGLGLRHESDVWIADSAAAFAEAVVRLLGDAELRDRVAAEGRAHVERSFDWKRIGMLQRDLPRNLVHREVRIRPATARDIPAITAIQATAPEASQWLPEDYLTFDCEVALAGMRIAGFLVSRKVDEGEREILNLAVDPEFRRRGVATALIRHALEQSRGTHFLEVRESNAMARALYRGVGFEEVGERPGYYENPPETGIVMRIYS